MALQSLFSNAFEASSAQTNLTSSNPATPKCQTSSPDGATTPHPSVCKDFATSSAYSSSSPKSPRQHTLSLLHHRTVSPLPSPSHGFENSLPHSTIVTTEGVSPPEQRDSWPNVISPPPFIASDAIGERSESDNDSGFSDNSSDTKSLESGLLDPETFPYDVEELSKRELLRHEAVWRLRKYHANPFQGTEHLHLETFNENPQKTIDLGAGTCVWANAFGDEYPSTIVEAIDYNAIVLQFCELFSLQVYPIVDDVEKEWTFEENSLDFIRAAHLLPSIKDRPRLFAQSRHSLKPLCRVEFIGFHYVPLAENGSEIENALHSFYQRLAEALSKAKLNLNAITKTREELISAGFVNVREEVLRMPIGDWMEDPELNKIGELFKRVVNSEIPDTASRAIEDGLGWSSLEVNVLGAKAQGSLGSLMYFPLYIVTGQKPASRKAT